MRIFQKVVSSSTLTFTFSSLVGSTTYGVAVFALHGLCISGSSNTITFTTSSSTGNHLLTSLTHYWSMETLAPNTPDLVGTLNLVSVGGNQDFSVNAGGIINSCVNSNGASGFNSIGVDPTNATDIMASTGIPQTYQVWIWLGAAQISATTGFVSVTRNAANANYCSLRFVNATGKFTWRVFDSTNAAVDLVYSVAPSTQAWHHIVCGVDTTAGQTFMYLDGGGKQTAALANGPKPSGTQTGLIFFNEDPAIGDPVARIDEVAMWNNRLLSATDVTNLYNGGAGLPFSSYTN